MTTTPILPTAGEEMTGNELIAQLREHQLTHKIWAEWFEAHPEDPRQHTEGIGDAVFHRQIEAKYSEMIRCVQRLMSEA